MLIVVMLSVVKVSAVTPSAVAPQDEQFNLFCPSVNNNKRGAVTFGQMSLRQVTFGQASLHQMTICLSWQF
jgi:hypothetical protein